MAMNVNLNADEIFNSLAVNAKRAIPIESIEIFNELGSTQEYLKTKLAGMASLKKQKPEMSVVVAESQLCGQGRMNRSWQASSGQNILLSCSWDFDVIPKDLPSLSLALMVVLAEYMQEEFALPVSIKWPNDLLLKGEKLAGLLVNVETGHQCKVVVGLGLNVKQSFSSNQIDKLNQAWTDMFQHGVEQVDRNKMIADIISRWVDVFLHYLESGSESVSSSVFLAFQNRWNQLSEHKDKLVIAEKVSEQGKVEVISGIMIGVDPSGFLLIRSGEDNVNNANGGSAESVKLHKISDSTFSLRCCDSGVGA